MNLSLQPVTRENYQAILQLKVAENQENWVAPNWKSLVEAAYEPELNLLAVYQDTTPVGLLLYDFDEDMGGWTMSRLMIDQHFQHQGLGKLALEQFLDFFKQHHPDQPLYTSAELDNPVAQLLYLNHGFAKVGQLSYESDGQIFHEVKMRKD